MALNLDTRHRAMLQEMGITVWMPKLVPAPLSPPAPAAVAVDIAPPAVVAATPSVAMPSPVPHTATQTPAPQPQAIPVVAAPLPEATPSVEWHMAPAIQAYPTATEGNANDAWLVIWECANPSAPLEGETGKLLNNMLRALRLHHSPHVWIASMQRPGAEALPLSDLPQAPVAWQTLPQGLASNVQSTHPARILLLGMQSARAVLASTEALGRLRAQVHQVHQIPTVVSYDPAYLLRSPHAKPAAWTDLCRAHALRPPSAT